MPRPPGKPRPSSRVSRVRPGPDPGWARLVCREVGVQRALLPAWKVVLSRLLSGPLSWVFRPGHRAPVWLAFLAPAGRGLPSSPAMAPWVAHRFGKRFPFLFDVFLFRFAVSPSASRPQTRPSPGGLQDLRACGAWVPPHGARRQPGARSPEPVHAPAWGVPASPSRRGPVYGDLPRGARTRAWPAAPAAGPSLSAPFPSPPQAASFPLTCSLEVKPSGESPVLDFPELGRKIRVSYSFCFSAETCDSRVSSFLACSPRPPPRPRPPSSAAPAGPRAVPTWGCVSAAPFPRRVPPTPSLVLRCRTPSSYLSRRGPVFGLVGPAFVSVALCVAGLSRRLVLGVPQAPVTRPGSACKPRLPASRQDVAGGWVSSSATTRRSLPGAPAGRPGGE